MKKLILAGAALALLAAPAFAASKVRMPPPVQLPFDPLGLNGDASAAPSKLPIALPIDPLGLNKTGLQTPDQIVDKVRAWATSDGVADLAAAITMAKAANNGVTLPCWTAIQAFVLQVQALPPADQLPPLHIAVDLEVATDLLVALQPNSPVITGCSALANFQKIAAVNMVSGIVTGALSLAKLAPVIP
jgi:hypothetical protein